MNLDFKKYFMQLQIPEELKSKYDLELSIKNLKAARILTFVGSFIVSFSIIFDYLITGTSNLVFCAYVRTFMTLSVFSCFLLTLNEKNRSFSANISMAGIILAGIGSVLIVHKMGYQHSYYAMLSLIYISNVLVPYGFKRTAIACFSIFLAYLLPIFIFNWGNIDWKILLNNGGFQFETIVLVLAFSVIQEERVKRDILSNLIIEKQSKDLESKSLELEKSYDDLKKSEETKKDFIANLTHDIKTPLSVIMGHSELLESDVEPNSVVWKATRFINRSATQLNHMIDKLIAISLLDKEDKLTLEYYNYTAFIKNLSQLFQGNAEKQGIKYSYEGPSDKIVVQIDAAWTERVFGNLIQNAFKFTNPGGSITVKVYSDYQYIYTEVRDTGVGIPADKIDRIFERNYQANEEKKKLGYGLGLSIVKETLKRLDGDISVRSKEGEGSVFVYKLPLHVDQNVEVVNKPYTGEERRGPDRRGKAERRSGFDRREIERLKTLRENVEKLTDVDNMKINISEYENKRPGRPTVLIVEDTPGQINLVIESLSGDYNLVFGQNGVEGYKKLQEYKDKIALILSDVKMPEMDGMEFCRQVFSSREYSHIPFIFITAYANIDEEFQGLKLGATDYIPKPINPNILKEKIHHWIIRRQNEILLQNISSDLENKTRDISKLKAVIEHEVVHPLLLLTGAESYFDRLYQKYYSVAPSDEKESWDGLKNLRSAIESIKSVVDVSRKLENSDLGKTQVENISKIIGEASARNDLLLRKNGIQVVVEKTENEFGLICDRSLLLHVFTNLIMNAAESIAEKPDRQEGVIKVSYSKGDNKQLQVMIEDNGMGIPEAVRKNLFQFKFTTKKSGTGIGLYLSLIIVKMHGGFIDVKSTEGKGTTFMVSLPFVSAEQDKLLV